MHYNPVGQLEENLIAALEKARREMLQERGQEEIDLPPVEVEVPREKSHGDYASNLAMVMAGRLGENPRRLAEYLAESLDFELLEKVEVAGPGFINLTLNNNWLAEALDKILEAGQDYGRTNQGRGQKVQLEFVSTNPTGPLHVGHSRGAVVGDVVASIMERAGYEVYREYYINDAGNQIDLLGESTYLRYQELFGREITLSKNSYRGDYIIDIARELKQEHGSKLLEKPEEEAFIIAREFALEQMLELIRQDLKKFGITFDNWFSERELHENNKIQEVSAELKEKGYVYEKEGALWFKSTAFGDDKDRVIIKSDGSPTYLAADIAYHQNKMERGFQHLINVWGADHHGYIERMKAVMEALGYERDNLEIIIVQIVTLLREGKKVPMSKRSGEFVTMREVLEEVGRDAARYFYSMRSTDSHFDFDLELAKKQSTENPVYYIQYAHARIMSIKDNAGKLLEEIEKGDASLLKTEEEIELLKLLARYPEELKVAAERRACHLVAAYAHELAGAFHVFYNKCRVITEDRELSLARLKLVEAARIVLRNVLEVIGVSAPEQM